MITKIQPRVSKYEFSDADLVKAKMFSQESIAYLEHQAADLLAQMVNIEFSSQEEVQREQIYQYIATQSRYRFLLETLSEVQETYQALAAGNDTPVVATAPATF